MNDLQIMQNPAIDAYGTMSRFLDRKARQMGVPIHGTFELTPLCNLDCKMCYVHLEPDQLGGRKLLSVEQWVSIMDQAVQAGMMDAVLTGGECLTYPGFDELYLYLESKGVRVAVLTNGLLLTERRISFFQAHPPKGIQISLYGSSEEEYEAVTGCKCFEQVNRSIQLTAATGIPLSIAITPNRFMVDGGEAVVRFANSIGIPFSINTSLFSPREETGRRDDVVDLDPKDYIRLHLLQRKLKGQMPIPASECDLPVPGQTRTPLKGLLCSAGKSAFCITWDGRMTPCNSFSDCEGFPLQDGFAAAWQHIRKVCSEYPLPEECGDCPYNKACPSCVMVHRQDAPAGHASPKVCERARQLVQSGLISLDK